MSYAKFFLNVNYWYQIKWIIKRPAKPKVSKKMSWHKFCFFVIKKNNFKGENFSTIFLLQLT